MKRDDGLDAARGLVFGLAVGAAVWALVVAVAWTVIP